MLSLSHGSLTASRSRARLALHSLPKSLVRRFRSRWGFARSAAVVTGPRSPCPAGLAHSRPCVTAAFKTRGPSEAVADVLRPCRSRSANGRTLECFRRCARRPAGIRCRSSRSTSTASSLTGACQNSRSSHATNGSACQPRAREKIGTDGTARVRHARRPSSAAASAQTSRSRATRGVTRRESKNSDKPFTAVNESNASTRDQHSQRVEVAMRR